MIVNQLLAGAAKRDITPLEDMMPMPFVGPVCFEKAADRVSVRTLFLSNGNHNVLFVNFDLGEVPYVSETLSTLTELTGLSCERIFLVATHTHSMPFFGTIIMPPNEATEPIYRRYYAFLMERVKEAVLEAMQNAKPAKMGYGEGCSYVNVNRDECVDGKYIYGNNFERPSDKTLRLIRLEDMEGQSIALVVNYAVHGVVMNGCMIGDGLWLGGDLPGRTATGLEEKLGGIVLWTPAASADQNPRYCTNFGYDESSPTLRTKSLGETGYMLLDTLVAEHIRDILRTNSTIACDQVSIHISAKEETVLVPAKEELKAVIPVVPFILKVLRLGDITIEGVSAEVATTVGAKLCALSGSQPTMMMTHVQGTGFYIPDEWEYEVGAQETGETLIGEGCAEPMFMDAFRKMLLECR